MSWAVIWADTVEQWAAGSFIKASRAVQFTALAADWVWPLFADDRLAAALVNGLDGILAWEARCDLDVWTRPGDAVVFSWAAAVGLRVITGH